MSELHVEGLKRWRAIARGRKRYDAAYKEGTDCIYITRTGLRDLHITIPGPEMKMRDWVGDCGSFDTMGCEGGREFMRIIWGVIRPDEFILSGFVGSASKFVHEVENFIAPLLYSQPYSISTEFSVRVTLSGYSRGGPQAILLGYYIKRKFDCRVDVMTFGAPNFLARSLCERIESENAIDIDITNIVIEGDVFPLGTSTLSIPGHTYIIEKKIPAIFLWQNYRRHKQYGKTLKNLASKAQNKPERTPL